MGSPDVTPLMLAGGMLAAGLLGAGATRFLRRRHNDGQPPVGTAPRAPAIPEHGANGSRGQRLHGAMIESLSARTCSDVRALLTESPDSADVWAAFDQLLRESLAEHLQAARVRCYHVRPGCETLQALIQTTANAPTGPSARVGLLGHVATTGREYVAGDPLHGELLDNLAAQDDVPWAWVWPIRTSQTTIGVVAVAHLREPGVLTPAVREAIGELLTLCWQHVACVERLRVARHTDPATGVLTRNDFFALAGHALADSYQENEPVVLAVLALEGLRRLDDAGRWGERDALVERLGHVIGRRVRADDLVGRFADDRFVVLLRRLDSGLGCLIAQKLLAGANECIARIDTAGEHVRMRVGVVGSGFSRPSLPDLLVSGFEAVEQARREHVTLKTDLDARPTEGPTP